MLELDLRAREGASKVLPLIPGRPLKFDTQDWYFRSFMLSIIEALNDVQILCSRLKVLTVPAGRVVQQAANDDGGPIPQLAPSVMDAIWKPLRNHHEWKTRLR